MKAIVILSAILAMAAAQDNVNWERWYTQDWPDASVRCPQDRYVVDYLRRGKTI